MAPIRFENVVNWNIVVTLGAAAVSGLLAFSAVQADVRYLRESLVELTRRDADREIRVRALELGFGRIEERLIAIQGLLQQQKGETQR